GRLYTNLPRLHNLYAVWLFVDATGDVEFAERRWRAMVEFYQRHLEDLTRYYGGPAAAIGMARLAALLANPNAAADYARDALQGLASVKDDAEMRGAMFRRYGFDPQWSKPFNFDGFHRLP